MIRWFPRSRTRYKQAEWPMFCHKIALPLRDRCLFAATGEPARSLAAGEVIITRGRYDRVAMWLLPASFIVAGAVWWATGSTILLQTAGTMVAAWLASPRGA